ncbi:TPA: hypothetical protein ACVOZG_004604 [Vibrio diabolicus]
MATIIAAVITAGASLYIHYDTPEVDVLGTVAEETKTDDTNTEKKASASISIADIFITPVDMKMATTFFAEISNIGLEPAKEVQLTMDFGESTVDECEIQPSSIKHSLNSESLALKSYTISEIGKGASIYVNCSLNLPYFKKIMIGNGNLSIEKSITYEAYKELKNGEELGFFGSIWRVVVIFFLVVFGLKIIGILFD